MTEALPPEVVDVLVERHRRFLEFLEPRVGADVAQRLAITPGNAAVRLHRARLALKERLERSCGTCTEHGCLDCTCKVKVSSNRNLPVAVIAGRFVRQHGRRRRP